MSSHNWVVNNELQARELCNYIMANVDKKLTYSIKPEQRTAQQNRAIHAYCRHVARDMEAHGIDMLEALTLPISPTMETVKMLMWGRIQKVMFDKDSTAELEPAEVDQIYQVMARHLITAHGIDIPFGR